MDYYAIIQSGTYIVAGVIYITPGSYTPPSGYFLALADPSVQSGYIYNPSTSTYAPPPPTMEQLQQECQSQVLALVATLNCGSFIIDPTSIEWGTIIPKINEENTTDSYDIVDTAGNYQTVTNAQVLATYVIYADLLQVVNSVIQSVYADIANSTTTTFAQVDSSVITYAAAVSARTHLTPVRTLIAGLVAQTTTINGHALSGNVTVTYSDLTGIPTKSFANPARSLNSSFQISSTRDAMVTYTVDIATTLSLSGGATGTVTLQYADNSGFTTNVVTVQSAVNGNTGTLTIGLALTQTGTAAVTGMIPAGKYVKLITTNTSGTPTFTFRAAQEVLI